MVCYALDRIIVIGRIYYKGISRGYIFVIISCKVQLINIMLAVCGPVLGFRCESIS